MCSVPGTCSGEDVRKEERRLEEEEQNRYQLGSSTLCWHCFEHNRQFLALGIILA